MTRIFFAGVKLKDEEGREGKRWKGVENIEGTEGGKCKQVWQSTDLRCVHTDDLRKHLLFDDLVKSSLKNVYYNLITIFVQDMV